MRAYPHQGDGVQFFAHILKPKGPTSLSGERVDRYDVAASAQWSLIAGPATPLGFFFSNPHSIETPEAMPEAGNRREKYGMGFFCDRIPHVDHIPCIIR